MDEVPLWWKTSDTRAYGIREGYALMMGTNDAVLMLTATAKLREPTIHSSIVTQRCAL